jgi:hypothetical protein
VGRRLVELEEGVRVDHPQMAGTELSTQAAVAAAGVDPQAERPRAGRGVLGWLFLNTQTFTRFQTLAVVLPFQRLHHLVVSK